MAGAKPALRSSKGVTRRSAKGVTTRNIGPTFLTADDDAGTFSMTYKVEQFEVPTDPPAPPILNQTRTGDAFIFGEGLGLILDRSFLTFQVQKVIRPPFADRTAPPVVTDTSADNINDYIIAGQVFGNSENALLAAVGTNPYTKDCEIQGGLLGLYFPTGLSNGQILEGIILVGEFGGPGVGRLIAFFDFDSPLILLPAGLGGDGIFFRTTFVPKFVL